MVLNRLSSLRPDTAFMNSVAESPNALWIMFRGGYPLTDKTKGDAIVKLSTAAVRPLLGAENVFGHALFEGVRDKTRVRSLSASRIRGPSVVFLGCDIPDSAEEYKKPATASDLEGVPYMAIAVDTLSRAELASTIRSDWQFCEVRRAASVQDEFDMYLLATARSMLDWNYRMKFCPSCGYRSHSTWAGWRRCCSTLLPGADISGRKPCPSATGLHNTEFPRTDAVVIVATTSTSGHKILLGKKVCYWSLVAGFMEPGETAAQAAAREVWEETGAWPHPSNLMIGYRAVADETQIPRVDIDDELQDARWFTKEEIKAVLAHPRGTTVRKREDSQTGPEDKNVLLDPAFYLPSKSSLSGQLIASWAFEE
ncbi:NUDIX hydrolase domain-like protein [Auriculariales sp. MPI-PUGE-AT-0066]|nr:NUDIX hydrolase domain-like protein [Auriculariales sp. MPI-PUGE-AT-0066]